ncbi:MAG TPA: SIMPL domain-containing protein [Streptosporangiaceae bacterium]|nr:SIMPL domain-containing protein [Streptosporangiaceae bacterium]
MHLTFTPRLRAVAAGGGAAALLIGAYALGAGPGSAPPAAGTTVTTAAVGNTAGSTGGLPAARVTVTGTGTVSGTPNQLMLSMGVQVSGPSVSSALGQANQAVRRVTAALRARGVAPADIQTSDLYVQPNYQPNGAAPSSYAVSESLTATLRDIATAGAVISAAVQAGGNAVVVDGISLNLSQSSGLLAAARAAAMADARTRAGQYARAAGRGLGPVLNIAEQSSATPLPYANSAAGDKASPVPISPGTQQLSVTVTVTFTLT